MFHTKNILTDLIIIKYKWIGSPKFLTNKTKIKIFLAKTDSVCKL